MQSLSDGNVHVRAYQNDIALAIAEPQNQHFGQKLADLPGREIDHRQQLLADQRLRLIMRGDLRARFLLAKIGAEIHPELDRGLARLGVGLGTGDTADPDIDLEKVIEPDLSHCAIPANGPPPPPPCAPSAAAGRCPHPSAPPAPPAWCRWGW